MLDNVVSKGQLLADDVLRFVAGQLHDPMIALSLHQSGEEPRLLASLDMTDDLARYVLCSVERDLEQEQARSDGAWPGAASAPDDAQDGSNGAVARTTFRRRVDARRSLALSACGVGPRMRGNGQVSPRTRGYIELLLHMLWEAESCRERSRMLTGLLDTFDVAILLLEDCGQVSFLNDRARDLLARSEGIRRAGAAIAACDMETSIRLNMLIQRVLDLSDDSITVLAPQLLLLPRHGQVALVATITRIPRDAMIHKTGIAAICILDPDQNSSAMAEALFRAYGLTQSESHLAMQIVAGLSLNDAAARMRVSTQTARTYLKQAFWKTGTHRQADLVRRVLNSVVRVGQLAANPPFGNAAPRKW